MITNSGKEVLSKYLLGQTPSYATHIAIGCGQRPLSSSESFSDYSEKNTLDFEMLRIPISSRGFVEDEDGTKLSLTAEIPTENRYEITEVGLWSGGENSLARGFDSKIFFNFEEKWQIHGESISNIPFLDSLGTGTDINDRGYEIFSALCGDPVLESSSRKNKKEGPRFLNSSIFMRGDSSEIISDFIEITSASSNGTTLTYTCSNTFSIGDKVTVSGTNNILFDVVGATVTAANSTTFQISKVVSSTEVASGGVVWITGSWSTLQSTEFTSNHIHLNSINFNISNNSSDDLLIIAFSLVDKIAIETGNPDRVQFLIEFFRNEISTDVGYAKIELYLDGGIFSNRYQSIAIPISDLITSVDFTSSEARTVRISSSVFVDDGGSVVPSENHYVALDGIRLENISTNNPLYKMVGYSVIKNASGYPIIKFNNTNNYVEFRFGIGVS